MEEGKASWDVVISSDKGRLRLNLKELVRYKDLIYLFVKRDFVANYKQTILGPLWHVIQPILTTITFVIIFGNIAGMSTDGTPRILFYMTGIVSWSYFSLCLNKTSTTFVANAHLFSKVYFPRLVIPVSVVISNLLSFFVQFVLLWVVLVLYCFNTDYNFTGNIYLLLVPVLVILMAFIGLGLGIIVSSLTTKYRDLGFLVVFGTQLMMYISTVLFPLSSVSGNMKTVILLNPMSSIIETMRFAMLGQGEFNWLHLGYSATFAVVVFVIGVVMFNRIERTFNDTV